MSALEFVSALLAIVIIDVVLAGDNAIVIALAVRRLSRPLQRRAIVCGTAGAVVMRIAMTLIVVWLLRIPGLLIAGGAMLTWIAYRLMAAEEQPGGSVRDAGTLWGALKTIVVADMVMGLDNVLAVAGAAHGSFLLVVLGLAISVPIVVWGSSLLLGFVERFPALVYVGAGVLAWTAARMATAEPLLSGFFEDHDFAVPLLYAVIVPGVLWAGFARNHRRVESRIRARLEHQARQESAEPAARHIQGGVSMLKVLIPVDGSRNSENAVRHILAQYARHRGIEVHLLNVQGPFSRYIARFLGRKNCDAFHQEQAHKALRAVRRTLEAAGVPHTVHVALGDKARAIVETAQRLHCDRIVMGTARKSSFTRMVEASVTNRVLELTTLPVEVIAGASVSRLERYGIPAGIGMAVALLLLVEAD